MKGVLAWLKGYLWFRFLLKRWRHARRQLRKKQKRIPTFIRKFRSRLRSKQLVITQQVKTLGEQSTEIGQLNREVASLRQRVIALREANRYLEQKTDAESEQLRIMILYWSTSVTWRRKRFLEDFIFNWLINHLAFPPAERAFLETNYIDRRSKQEFAEIRVKLEKFETDLQLGKVKPPNIINAIRRIIQARVT